MKNIAFTICSNNYLGQAKVLSDSVYEHSRDKYDFYIVLCDVKNEAIDYSEFHANFVEAKDLEIKNFEWMTQHYNIVELNTAIKPYAFQYLIKNYNPKYVHYLDPDTCTYTNLTAIEEEMGDSSILLTPHEMASLPFDGGRPTDCTFLNAGIYNLGFLGLKNDDISLSMLKWWCVFLAEHCINNVSKGLFVDQLPMNLVPIFFDNVKVTKHKGLNAAYWNLHEREIQYDKGQWKVSNNYKLVFYHFSNFMIDKPEIISAFDSRHSMLNSDDLKKLFGEYVKRRNATNNSLYKSIPCVYIKKHSYPKKLVIRFLLALRRRVDSYLEIVNNL